MMVTQPRERLDEPVRDAGAIAYCAGWLTRRVRDFRSGPGCHHRVHPPVAAFSSVPPRRCDLSGSGGWHPPRPRGGGRLRRLVRARRPGRPCQSMGGGRHGRGWL